MYTNLKFFNQFSPTTVVGFSQELYSGTFIKDFPAFMDSADDYSPELPAMYGRLFSAIDTPQKRNETQTYFREKAIQNILKDPVDYGVWRIKKMGKIKKKKKLFFYHETNHEQYWHISLWAHRVLLLFAAIGIVQGIRWNRSIRGNRIEKDNLVQLFSSYCLGTIGLFTLLFSLTHAESRLTIPLMPIVFLYAGVGLYCVFNYRNEKTS